MTWINVHGHMLMISNLNDRYTVKIITPYGVKRDRSVKRVKSYSKWSEIYSK